ncbi:TIGR02594 family protein [Paracoccus versutus]|uniref:Uncharacterized protein (TIGR02594 family) n=1 Tax=Paracoccus versutus TaxID=34007 RepID=A0AAQ0HHE4_PARVE|nr:peptidoglycan-binding protein [Paracoccus versutus]REG45849.1 uncharacterized protein (TIGR02594 family) [Paracoccus versutus]WEJ77705.1 TIGR02594 family protein [Paracoccus versutus]
MDSIAWVQRRLIMHGFDPGIVDGIWGANTRNALIAFQQRSGIPANGRVDNATLHALRAGWLGNPPGPEWPPRIALDYFPWMQIALLKMGLHERRDIIELSKFLVADGRTLGDPSRNLWCGDFVQTCIAIAIPEAPVPVNPYASREWMKFGQAVEPCFGSILVFWRKSVSGGEGHVGFYYSEDSESFHVLGGNQGDSVSISKVHKSRFLSAQLPAIGGPYPRRRITSAADWSKSYDEA